MRESQGADWGKGYRRAKGSCCTLTRLIADACYLLVFTLGFTTGAEKWKALETSFFVAAGRFLIEEGKPTTVEYKVSQVIAG